MGLTDIVLQNNQRKSDTFNTVSDMVAATWLKVGDRVRTLGYNSIGDGGGNDYEVVVAGTGLDDGGSFINLTISGHQAKGLFVNSAVNVKQFGVVGDGITDDTINVQNALIFADQNALIFADEIITKPLSVTDKSVLSNKTGLIKRLPDTDTDTLVTLSTGSDGSWLSNLNLTNDKSINGFEGHVVKVNVDNVSIDRITVSDFGSSIANNGDGTGVLFVHPLDDVIKHPRLNNSTIKGNASSDLTFGTIFANTRYGFMVNNFAEDISRYAFELKGAEAKYNQLMGLTANNSQWAVAYGQSGAGVDGADFNLATGIVAAACDSGYVVGEGTNNLLVGMVWDPTNSPNLPEGNYGVSFSNGAEGNAAFAVLAGGTQNNYTAYFDGDRNFAQIVAHNTAPKLCAFFGNGNVLEVSHPGNRNTIRNEVDDNSGFDIDDTSGLGNVYYCHATGEYVGSLRGKFGWVLGESGASSTSAQKIEFENDDSIISAYRTTGAVGEYVGIDHAVPGDAGRGRLIHILGATANDDLWRIDTGSNAVLKITTSGLNPWVDNTYSLGSASNRYSEVFSSTGTINTSDDREKTYLDISETENLIATELKTLIRKFKWNHAIEEKGESNARIHFGTSAQAVKTVFEKHGLNPFEYGLLCYDEWDEETDEDGNIVLEAGNRYGIRYNELLCFIISAI